ncbi:MAG: sulfurtransferase, partial [Burkholderiales bacterium]
IVLDARAPARWRGETEPIDPEAGRIPGSLNRFNSGNLTPEGVHKPAAQLRAEFEAVLAGRQPAEVVHSCGSGVAACHNLLAMEIAGLQGGKLYAGSWSEWIADPARPRERG